MMSFALSTKSDWILLLNCSTDVLLEMLIIGIFKSISYLLSTTRFVDTTV